MSQDYARRVNVMCEALAYAVAVMISELAQDLDGGLFALSKGDEERCVAVTVPCLLGTLVQLVNFLKSCGAEEEL